MRRFVILLALLLCGVVFGLDTQPPALPKPSQGTRVVPSPQLPAGPEAAPPLYTLAPTGVGLMLNPPGAATLSLRSPAYPPSVRLLGTFGLERNLTPLGGLYGSLRYELDVVSAETAATYSVQAGVWPCDPHRTGRRMAASGFTLGVQGLSARGPRRREGRLESGLLSVGAAPLQVDAGGEFTVSDALADRWGYALTGWRTGLTGVWGATGVDPSLGAWADGSFAGRVGAWPLEFGVRGGYRPAWPAPLPDGTFGVLVTAGTRVSVSARAVFGEGLLRLERVTLEPRLRGFVQTSSEPFANVAPGLGADLSLSLDAVVNRTQRVAVGGTVGYAGSFWYRLNLRVQPRRSSLNRRSGARAGPCRR